MSYNNPDTTIHHCPHTRNDFQKKISAMNMWGLKWQINYEVKGIMILLYSHSPSVDPPQAMGRAVLIEQG